MDDHPRSSFATLLGRADAPHRHVQVLRCGLERSRVANRLDNVCDIWLEERERLAERAEAAWRREQTALA